MALNVPDQYAEMVASFLHGEEDATARFMGFYRQAREEILRLLDPINMPTAAEQSFFTQIMAEIDAVLGEVDAGAATWANETIPNAFARGATANGMPTFTTVHDEAVRALSDNMLDLIRNTNGGVRRVIQQELSLSLIGSVQPRDLLSRIAASGLSPGRWRSVEERAGVIARTETMRAFNVGNMAAIIESGAKRFTWIAAEDEAVCPICGPRDGQTFRIDEMAPPAHPRCRCTVAAEFSEEAAQAIAEAVPAVVARTPQEAL